MIEEQVVFASGASGKSGVKLRADARDVEVRADRERRALPAPDDRAAVVVDFESNEAPAAERDPAETYAGLVMKAAQLEGKRVIVRILEVPRPQQDS